MEDPNRLESTALTPNGGNSSSMKENTSSIGRTEKLLMSQEERILKANVLLFTTNIMVPIRDGMSSILTKPIRFQERDLMKNLDSIEIDHSTLDQDFQ